MTDQGNNLNRLPVTVEALIDIVARRIGVLPEQILARDRHAHLVLARHIIVYLLREYTSLSYPEIGRGMRRTHTAIYQAHIQLINRIDDFALIPGSAEPVRIVDLVEELRKQIEELY